MGALSSVAFKPLSNFTKSFIVFLGETRDLVPQSSCASITEKLGKKSILTINPWVDGVWRQSLFLVMCLVSQRERK